MRIKDIFKKSGYFWLPSNASKKIPGTLSISDGGEIELEIIGFFEDEIEKIPNRRKFARVSGYIESDGDVTLDECLYLHQSISFGGLSKSLLRVHRAYVGADFQENNEVLVNTFQFSVEGIDEWVGVTGIQVDRNLENNTANILYTLPEDFSCKLDNGMELLISFSWTMPGFPVLTEAKITQSAYFKLTSSTNRSVNDFISIAFKVTSLLCFAIDKTVSLHHVSIASDENVISINDKLYPKTIHLYYPSKPFTEVLPRIEWHNMLFNFATIRDNAATIFNNWISAYDVIQPSLYLYFSTQNDTQSNSSGKFLALVQGLETYHRRTFDEKQMPNDDFLALSLKLISACPDEKKKWLKSKLKYANEITLAKRLEQILKPFDCFFGTKENVKKTIRKIVDTRNYLTHYDLSLKEKAAGGIDLYYLTLKAEAIFQLLLLQVVGFKYTEIKTIFDNYNKRNYKLSSF